MQAFVPTSSSTGSSNSRRNQPRLPTASTLVASHSGSNNKLTCVYCDGDHTSSSCPTVADTAKRKDILRKAGRCFVCLRRHHFSRDCHSTFNCKKCRGRHHVSICTRATGRAAPSKPPTTGSANSQSEGSRPREATPTTSSLCTDAPAQILLQTARLDLVNPRVAGTDAVARAASSLCTDAPAQILLQTARLDLVNPRVAGTDAVARAIFDSGSQRTYVSSQIRERLNLPTASTERIQVKTFGSTESCDQTYDIVHLGVKIKGGEILTVAALVVPFVCSPLTSQPIDTSRRVYEHLVGLELADSADSNDVLEVDVLIGSDWYWSLVTGRVIKGKTGPIAIHTKVGWILSGPMSNQATANLTLSSAHTLKVDTIAEPSLDDRLKQFWELQALGIPRDESEKFLQQISFDGERYMVNLPWKEYHPPLPDHYELFRKRLGGLLRRLKQNPQLLREYDNIICDQLQKGIVEKVSDPIGDRTHYLPHHGVVRQDKTTSKLRIDFDASARSTGPSLNDCLYTGPKFCQSIFEILLRFRHQRVALIGDIEKAFLMVSVRESDRDSLRFLWTKNFDSEQPEPIALRFTRVVFGVSSSPFLLNATLHHHLETFREVNPEFVEKFSSSIYVDDLVSGSHNVPSAHNFYLKSKLGLGTAGFKLRKFVTNSAELQGLIEEEENPAVNEGVQANTEEDQSYAKASLGVKTVEGPGVTKVLGVQWNVPLDELHWDITQTMEDFEPTKRNLVSITAKFFDPLGIVSPVTILFKMFCQQLCTAKVGWDDPLIGQFLEKWNQLLSMLRGAKTISVPRCVYHMDSPKIASLIGFCDASAKAYAAVVYLRLENETSVDVKLLAAKTRVAPVPGATIRRLELLSALLLSKLLDSIRAAIQSHLSLGDPVCFTDSTASLYWIRGVHHEWKQFVENRVTAIRRLVSPDHWKHCPGIENPADIPSRGMSAFALSESSVWLRGPEWLWQRTFPEEMKDSTVT